MPCDPWRWPRLHAFFGGYFHQDWDLEGPDWPDVVAAYREDAGAAEAAAAADEVDGLLRDAGSDGELEDLLWRGLGCEYDPRPDLGGPTVRAWLGQVAAALRSGAARQETL